MDTMTEEVNVFESLIKAQEAYQAIPKEFFNRKLDGLIETLSCPKCGCIFAQIDWSVTSGFYFNQPIICCGKLLH